MFPQDYSLRPLFCVFPCVVIRYLCDRIAHGYIVDTRQSHGGPNVNICELLGHDKKYYISSLWTNDDIWRLRSESTSALVKAYCLTAHPLLESISTYHQNVFFSEFTGEQFHSRCAWDYTFEITITSPSGLRIDNTKQIMEKPSAYFVGYTAAVLPGSYRSPHIGIPQGNWGAGPAID